MRKPLPYSPDLGSRLRATCQASDRAVWLRLGSPDRELFSAFPVRSLLFSNQRITSETECKLLIAESWPDFWVQLPKLIEDLPCCEELSDLPFRGGLIGFLSYDMGTVGSSLQFPAAYMGVYPHFILINHRKKTAELVHLPAAQDDRTRWLALLKNVIEVTNPGNFYEAFTLRKPFRPLTSAARYQSDFTRIQQYLLQGDCYQVNYAQAFLATCQGSSAAAMDTLLRVSNPTYAAWLSLPEGDVFSLSPELFLRAESGVITTKPIKGTVARSSDLEADAHSRLLLQSSLKNRAENLMIVDLMRNDLGRHAEAGSIEVSSLFEVESLPQVHHLVSTISAHLRNNSHVIDLIKDIFPGGSITGAPKKRAMEIIAELEPTPRSVYCGSIGYINPDGDAQLNIAIRTMLRLGNELYAWAGGGIVADSDCESEYQECFDKIGALMDALENAGE